MLANFKKRVCAQQHYETEIDDTITQGRTCTRSCSQSDPRSLLPSSRSVTQVLYPPSYLGIYSPFPDPPPYPVQEDVSTSSSTTSIQGTHGCPDPLAEEPALTGVPSQDISCSTVPSGELNPPVIHLGGDLEDTEPLPAYSRFDQRRPRFPVASDVLGPYPPLSVLRQAAH